MNQLRVDEGVRAADAARSELYDTLGQLRERLDYASRVDRALDRARVAASREHREHPLAFGLAVVGVAGAVGLAVWGIAGRVIRAFE